ncbi:RNA 2',3'-cyclic phosphodiesterase [Streptomyces sp. B6B3]|uniref:RNA 2',3'-cyclic phosphodiesterase n=1 Tax=Streptomyces sp. B6B3 TaxID=3153570 RepID=UPI00325F7146
MSERYFTAILPPPAVAEELAGVVRQLAALPDAERLRWTERDGWHITLAYYGQISDPDRLAELGDRLAATARALQPFALRLAGGESLGEWALGAGVAGDRTTLAGLAAATAEDGLALGLPETAERHPSYRPHLTVARNVRSPRPVAFAPYTAALAPFTGREWLAAELVLMRNANADERPGAHTYVPAATWPLGGRAAEGT